MICSNEKFAVLTAKDATFANALKADLDQSDDSKRSLKEISVSNFEVLCTVLDLYTPTNKCDSNNDGVIKGD